MNKEFNCPVEATISLIGGKYKSVILFHLMGKTLRYSENARTATSGTGKRWTYQKNRLSGCPAQNRVQPDGVWREPVTDPKCHV